jgi:hypothetical protein
MLIINHGIRTEGGIIRMDSQQPKQPVTLQAENSSLSLLREAWAIMVSEYAGPRPTIDPNYELEYYTGTALIGAEFSVGILRDIAPKCNLEQLRQRVETQTGSLQKELRVLFYALQFLLEERKN